MVDDLPRFRDDPPSSTVERKTANGYTFTHEGNDPLRIEDIDENGRWITITNTSTIMDSHLLAYKLRRLVDSKPEMIYEFTDDIILPPNGSINIFARGAGPHNPEAGDLVNEDLNTWSQGSSEDTMLTDRHGNIKSKLIKRKESRY
ncbi:hypothetical protein SNEBB_004564 [Seison nebaliae]|nr:hypothetical protein SNEBB_004564 [Seison nebaliae]